MTTRMRHLASSLGAVVACLVLGSAAMGAEVTLKMKGGDFAVTGDLQSFDNSKYVIQSKSFGTMSLDSARFDCEGAGCPRAGAPVTTTASLAPDRSTTSIISVTGSNTIGNQLMPALIQSYAEANKLKATKIAGDTPLDATFKLSDAKGRDVGTVNLHRHGSSTAFAGFEKKTVDIGMASRPVKQEEASRLVNLGLSDLRQPQSEHVLGLDGLQVLIAPGNAAVSLSVDSIAKIFSGQIKDWSEIGLSPGKINLFAPDSESGTFDTFETLVLKPRNLKIADNAKRLADLSELSDLVAADPLSIGFASIAYQRNAKAVNIETSCGLIVKPSLFSIKTEEYPLTRRLFLYTNGEPRDPLAKGLLDYALSQAAQAEVRANDFVDQAPTASEFQAQTNRIAYALNASGADFDLELMKTLISELKPASRLTTTLRFETANFALDTKAVGDLARLRTTLESNQYRGKTIILAGFADGVGRFDSNLQLSQKRAAAVMNALQRSNGAPIQAKLVTRAYSQLAPVACNDTADARSFNRRVEIWVK